MNILYIITILAVFTLFMLIHKTEKKQNLIGWMAITTILTMCYNVLLSLIFSFIGILCTLLTLSICNAVVIAILAAILIKRKKIQKYYVKIADIIFSVILLILVIFTAYEQYGFPFKVKYEITDGSTHYYYAEKFYETSELLYKGTNEDLFGLYDSDFRLPGAYVNEGILFKAFDGIVSKISLFVIFDLVVLYISGILFYQLLRTYGKDNKTMQILSAVFAILYLVGYQLNSMIYGFVYLSLALDMTIAFLLLMGSYQKERIHKKIALPILGMLSFGIFFSYAYFIPIIYLGIIIDIAIKAAINDEDVITKNNVITTVSVVIIPLILGLIYFIILPNISGIDTEIATMAVEGVIYENYITNLLAFIPMIVLGVIALVKNKKIEYNLSTIILGLAIIFVIILFAGNKLNLVSNYYCFKAYYIIWLLVMYNAYMMINNAIQDKNKILRISTYAYTGIYVVAIVISTVLMKNIGINDIFHNNIERITADRQILNNGELEILRESEKLTKKEQLYVLNSKYEGKMKWMTVLFDKQQIYEDANNESETTIAKWLEEKEEKYYLAYNEDYKMIDKKYDGLDENSEQYKIIYENEYGFILERK